MTYDTDLVYYARVVGVDVEFHHDDRDGWQVFNPETGGRFPITERGMGACGASRVPTADGPDPLTSRSLRLLS